MGDSGPRGDLQKCEECAQSHYKKDNCTKREALTFCQLLPPPTPAPVSDKCQTLLKEKCEDVAADREKCEECLEKLEPKDGCTLKEEFAFCDAGGKPPGPKPQPIEDECLAELNAHCKDRRDNTTECDGCLKRVDRAFKANCTKKDEFKFYEGGKPPAPVGDKCVKLLEEDCLKFVAMKNESMCYECTQKAAGTKPDIDCTEREEYTFCTCEFPPVVPPPPLPQPLDLFCCCARKELPV